MNKFSYASPASFAEAGALNHQDVNGLRLRVAPALRAVSAAVAERAGREHRGHALRFLHDLKTETPTHAVGEPGLEVARLRARHQRERVR